MILYSPQFTCKIGRMIPERCRVFTESSRVVFDCHPDAIGVRVVLMPAIEEVAIIIDASKGIMGKARTHLHIFIDALEVVLAKLLHSSHAIDLRVYLEQFWIGVVVVDATVGFCRGKPNVHLDVVRLVSVPRVRPFTRSSRNVRVQFNCPHVKLWGLVQRDVPRESRVQCCLLKPAVF